MSIKLLGLAAAFALIPGVVLAQTTRPQQPPVRTSSAGEVSENVPQAAIEAQKNPQLIGSPAWWSTHSTADGQPLNAAEQRRKP
jgi:hypothetical protein